MIRFRIPHPLLQKYRYLPTHTFSLPKFLPNQSSIYFKPSCHSLTTRFFSTGLPQLDPDHPKNHREKQTTIQKWKSKAKEAFHHTMTWLKSGTKLFVANVKVSSQLLKKYTLGYPLTRREQHLLHTTMKDCLKLIPFSFFIIVPFAELLLPFYLKFFPQMLPSTFAQSDTEAAYLKKIKNKQQLAKYFQDVVQQTTRNLAESVDGQGDKKAALIKDFEEKMVNNYYANGLPGLEELLPLAKLFKEEFRLDSLNLKTLQTICRLLGITPYGYQKYVVIQLRYHMLKIQSEDRRILWEGIDNLTHDELVDISKNRAMRFFDISDDVMRKNISSWITLASHPDIPIVLLLWSRCMTITHSPLKTERVFTQEPIETEREEKKDDTVQEK